MNWSVVFRWKLSTFRAISVRPKRHRKRKNEYKYKLSYCLISILTLYVPIIAILDIRKTTLFYEGESVVYDGFKYVWPVKG